MRILKRLCKITAMMSLNAAGNKAVGQGDPLEADAENDASQRNQQNVV